MKNALTASFTLAEAHDLLRTAWDAEPAFAPTATAMITVATGLGFDRDEMEAWFRRAMGADPDCRAACLAKLNWLMPKWHGSQRDVEEFTYQCYRTQNWYAGIAHCVDLGYVFNPGFASLPDHNKYLRDPIGWRNTRAAYEGFLKEDPGDRWARSRYALLCAMVERWDEAAEQFEALNDRPWQKEFLSRKVYEYYREKAKAAAVKED